MTLYTDLSPTACAVLRARVQDGSLPAGAVLRADVRRAMVRAWMRGYAAGKSDARRQGGGA